MDPTSDQNINWNNLLQTLGGLGSTALGTLGTQQSYNVLQNALNTIGPTQLGNFGLSGPGGMLGSYNLGSGTGTVNLGAFNPAYNGLAGVGSGGISGYNTSLIPGLTTTASGTLSPALTSLLGAYGQNSALQSAAMTQAGSLNDTYNSIFNNTLSNMRAQAAPAIQQQAYGLQNSLFGNGVLDSTGAGSGALAAQNFGRGVAQGDASMQLAAQQAALSGMQGQAGIASTLSGTGTNLLTGALNNFGNTSQLISGLNTAGLNNSLSALQGAGVLNTMGLNNYNAGLQTALSAASARNGSLFPYAVTASSLAQMPTLAASLGSALNPAGGNILSGISGLFNNIPGVNNLINNIGNWLGGSGTGSIAPVSIQGLGSLGDLGPAADASLNADADAALTEASNALGGFSSAGGEAAASGIAGGMAPVAVQGLGDLGSGAAATTASDAAAAYGDASAALGGSSSAAAGGAGASALGTAAGILGGAGLAGGLVYGLGSLLDALFPMRQMTSQQIAAYLPAQTPAQQAAQQQNPLQTTNTYPGLFAGAGAVPGVLTPAQSYFFG